VAGCPLLHPDRRNCSVVQSLLPPLTQMASIRNNRLAELSVPATGKGGQNWGIEDPNYPSNGAVPNVKVAGYPRSRLRDLGVRGAISLTSRPRLPDNLPICKLTRSDPIASKIPFMQVQQFSLSHLPKAHPLVHCDMLVAPLSKYELSNVKTKGGLTTYSSGSDPVSRGADFCRRVMPFRSVLELCRWIREKSGCF
jgi:hypothetical protein